MSLDTRYRPQTYDDVLGQEATVSVLKQFMVEGRGYHQSYVFCGQHGSGKTTTGRILARALLCEAPVDGAPAVLAVLALERIPATPWLQRLLAQGLRLHLGGHCGHQADGAVRNEGQRVSVKGPFQRGGGSGLRRVTLWSVSFALPGIL